MNSLILWLAHFALGLPSVVTLLPTIITDAEDVFHSVAQGEGGPKKVAAAATAVGQLATTLATVAAKYPTD